VLALIAAFMGGIKVESNHRDAQLLAQERAYTEQYRAEVQRAAAAEKALREKKDVIRTVYKRIEVKVAEIIDRPVYHNVCIDDDGMRLINDAILGRSPLDGEMPAASSPVDK
jgi:hypothetical protein